MISIKELAQKPVKLAPGHRTCAGCALPIITRLVLAATNKPTIVGCATSCLEVTTTIYPYTSWNIPFIHNAFENVAATISGVESAYKALKKKGEVKKDIDFVAFAGDGGSYDIGLQSLSGALERGHKFVFVALDNEGYMNTGGQRSSATPYGAATTTSPSGKIIPGKQEFKKDFAKIAVAHNIPYVAQAAVHNWSDLVMKAEKAFKAEGPAVLIVFSPCTNNWKFPPSQTIAISKLAVNSNFWPLYEVEDGVYKLNYRPSRPIQVEEFIKTQRRFKHLFTEKNKHVIEELQKHVDEEWLKILELCNEEPPKEEEEGEEIRKKERFF